MAGFIGLIYLIFWSMKKMLLHYNHLIMHSMLCVPLFVDETIKLILYLYLSSKIQIKLFR